MFSDLLTTARDMLYPELVHNLPSYSFKMNFNTNLSSTSYLPMVSFLRFFPPKSPYEFLFCPTRSTCHPHFTFHRGFYKRNFSLCGTAMKEMFAHAGNWTPVQTSPYLVTDWDIPTLSGEQKLSSPTFSRTSIYNVKINQWINRTIPPLKAHGLLVIPCAFLFLYSDHVNWSV